MYSDEETAEKSEAYRSFEQEMLKNEEKRTLHKAIAGLPQDYATVIHLLYFEDMSYSEAGAVMKKSRKQIENLIMRARAALHATMEREWSYE